MHDADPDIVIACLFVRGSDAAKFMERRVNQEYLKKVLTSGQGENDQWDDYQLPVVIRWNIRKMSDNNKRYMET